MRLHERTDDVGGQVVGADVLQGAAVAAERRAQPVDDDGGAGGIRGSSAPMLPRVVAGRTIGPPTRALGRPPVDLYPWFKLLHIFLAIVAVGFNISYAIWQARAARVPEHMGYRAARDQIPRRLHGKPVVWRSARSSASILVLIGPYDFTTSGSAVAIGLYLVLAWWPSLIYSPTLDDADRRLRSRRRRVRPTSEALAGRRDRSG